MADSASVSINSTTSVNKKMKVKLLRGMQLLFGHGMPKMKLVEFVGWLLMVVALIVLPGDDCPLIWGGGSCNHAFHLHCILKWVNSQTPQAHCPMCRREWQFKG